MAGGTAASTCSVCSRLQGPRWGESPGRVWPMGAAAGEGRQRGRALSVLAGRAAPRDF